MSYLKCYRPKQRLYLKELLDLLLQCCWQLSYRVQNATKNQKNCCHINSNHSHGSASKSHRWHIRDRRMLSRWSWCVAMVAPLLLTMVVVNNKTGTARTFGVDSSKFGFSSMWFDERSWVQRTANNFKIDCDLYILIHWKRISILIECLDSTKQRTERFKF